MNNFFDIHTHLLNEKYILRELFSEKTARGIAHLSSNFKQSSDAAYKHLVREYKQAGIDEKKLKLIVLTYDLDYVFQTNYGDPEPIKHRFDEQKARNERELQIIQKANEGIACKNKYSFCKFLEENENLRKANPQNIYLFYYFDPRRSGAMEKVKNEVRKKGESIDAKNYIGVKLYPSNGYSPLDPKMLELYQYCQQQDIPITVHFSRAGFSTFANAIEVKGDIMVNNVLKKVKNSYTHVFKNQLLNKNGYIKLSKLRKIQRIIKERAATLNHPFLWYLVLQEFKKLRINFAHYGSGDNAWTQWVLKFISEYDNVYTDISCSKPDEAEKFLRKLNKYQLKEKQIINKVLYGSDYALNELIFHGNDIIYPHLRNSLGDNFDIITSKNAEIFLKFNNK